MNLHKNHRLLVAALFISAVFVFIFSFTPGGARAKLGLSQDGQANRWITFTAQSVAGAPVDLTTIESSGSSISLSANIPGVWAGNEKRTDQSGTDSVFTSLDGDSLGHGEVYGQPDLPVLRKSVEIPWGASYELEILNVASIDTSLEDLGLPAPIWPLQPPDCKCDQETPFTLNSETYSANRFFPGVPVVLGEEYILRGHRVVVVEVWPVSYNPVTGQLHLISEVSFRLNLSGADMALSQSLADRYASPLFEERLSKDVLNFNLGKPVREFRSGLDSIGYLIITPDVYYDGMLPFKQVQEARGFQVTLTKLSDIPATTNQQIKSYIQTAYDTWAIPPSYVLLVGDTDTLPAWNSTTGAGKVTDLYYGTMDGATDWHPDLGRGRFPVRDQNQLSAIVNKHIAYHGLSGVEPWLKKVAFIGTCDNYSVAEGSHNYVINNFTLPNGFTGIFPNNPQPGGDKIYCVTYNGNTQNIRNAANDGRWAIVYSGHGSETGWADGNVSFSQNDVRNLTGLGFFPFVVSHSCLTNSFNMVESFGETWVIQQNKGALVFWGASNYTYWGEDDILEKAWFTSQFSSGLEGPDIATMTDYGLSQVEGQYPSMGRYYLEAYNVLGDPSVALILGPRNPDFTLSADPSTVEVCTASSASTTINAGSLVGYTAPVDLSVSGVPTGVTASFSLNPVTPPGSSLLTFQNASAQVGSYPLSVLGVSGSLSHSTPVNLKVYNALPGLPSLLTPGNGSTNQPLRPLFTWTASNQAGTYQIEVADDNAFSNPIISVNGLSGTEFTPDEDLPSNAVFYWRVKAENGCGSGSYSAVSMFITKALPGDCALGSLPVTLYSTDFESGPGDWTHEGTGDTWAISGNRFHSGASAFYAVTPNQISNQMLVSPQVSLPVGQSPLTLQFWNYQDMEDRSSGCYDGGLLEISTDNGISWTQLDDELLTDPYDGPFSTGNPIGVVDAWCGNPQDWLNSLVDLDAFAGQEVRFRFHVGTDYSVGYEGWYIDDISVNSCLPATYYATLSGDSFLDTVPDQSVIHTFTLTNVGLPDTFDLAIQPGEWPATLLTTTPLALSGAGGTAQIEVLVTPPAFDPFNLSVTDTFTLTVASQGDPSSTLQSKGTTHSIVTPDVSVTPSRSTLLGSPGTDVVHFFTVQNQGNFPDDFSLAAVSESWFYAMQDSTGPLDPGQTIEVPVTVSIPDQMKLGIIIATDHLTMTATSSLDADVMVEAIAVSNANVNPGISVTPEAQATSGNPGETVNFEITIENTGDYTDTFRLDLSGNFWAVEAPTTTGPLAPGISVTLIASVTIPDDPSMEPGALYSDSFAIRATSKWDDLTYSIANGTTTTELIAGMDLEGDLEGDAWVGESLLYEFTVKNTGNFADEFLFAVESDWEASLLQTTTGMLNPGQTALIQLAVRPPMTAQHGETGTATVTITSVRNPAMSVVHDISTHAWWHKVFLPLTRN